MFKNIKTVIKFFLFEPIDYLVRLNRTFYISKTILLVRVDRIGDYILFRNFIEVLKKSDKYKGYKITLCGNEVWKDLAEEYDKEYIDDFIWINVRKFNRNIFYRYKALLSIAKRDFEIVINPTYSRDFFCGDSIVKICNAKMKIGSVGNLNNIKKWQKSITDKYYTKLISASGRSLFEFYRNKEFFERLLCEKIFIKKTYFKKVRIKSNRISSEKYAVIVPGAGKNFRQWGVHEFIEIADYLSKKYKLDIAIIGGKKEQDLGRDIVNKANTNAIGNFTGALKLREVVGIIKAAQIVISNETFAVHIAAAVDTLCVCISNGNHFGRFNPYPREIFPNIETIYPPDIMNNLDKFDCLSQKYKYGSDLDINSIRAEDVKESVTEVMVR